MIRDHAREALRTVVPARGDPDGPLPAFMVALTVVTGLVDAFSFLDLGHVFVANVTGNVVFLAFALAGAKGFSIAASATAYGSFAVGSLIGGRLAARCAGRRARLLGAATSVQLVLVALATGLSAGEGAYLATGFRYGLIGVLAVAMGLQNAVARKLAIADLTTTVLTLTTTGIFADATLVGGPGSKAGRRILSIGAMFAGALVGATLVVHDLRSLVLVLALSLTLAVAGLVGLLGRREPSWASS